MCSSCFANKRQLAIISAKAGTGSYRRVWNLATARVANRYHTGVLVHLGQNMLHRDIASCKNEHEDTGVSGDDDDDGFPLADADDNDHIPWEANALGMVTRLPEKAEETTCIDHVVVVAAGKFGPVCLPFHRVSAKSSARHAQSTLVPCSTENCCCCCC